MRAGTLILSLLLIMSMFSLCSCGGDEDSGDEEGGDEDGETVWLPDGDDETEGEVSADGDGEQQIIDPGKSDYDGYWGIQDLNVPDWYGARQLTGLYLAVNGKYMAWWMPREDIVGCSGVDLIQMDAHKFVPEEGMDVCWYNFELNDQGYLILSYRSVNIESTEPVRFQFKKIDEIPGYDPTKCVEENTCPDYGEPLEIN